MNTNEEKQRFGWADISKALAIFFIVWGHAASGSESYFFRNVLYSFHIPTFLIISGFFIKDLKKEDLTFTGFLVFLKKQFFRILVPYLFWGIFFSDFSMKNILPILYGSYQSIKTVNQVGALWFIPAFFLARIIIRLIFTVFAKVRIKELVMVPLSVVFFAGGIMLPLLENGYPFAVNISLVFVGFMLIGYSARSLLKKLSESKFIRRISAFGIAFLLFAAGTFFRPDNLELVCFYKGEYGNLFWFFWNGFFGAFATVFFGMVLSQWKAKPIKILQFIGTESLGIMFVHVPIIRQLTMPLLNTIGFNSPLWLEAFFAAVLATALSIGIVVVFDRIAPVFVGKKEQFA